MRYFIYFLFSVLMLSSCSGIFYNKKNQRSSASEENNERTNKLPPPVVIGQLRDATPTAIPVKSPNKPIKEIKYDIRYYPKHTEEEKRQVRIDYNNCLFRHQDKENPHESCKYIQVREEDRIRFLGKRYCYGVKKDKESPVNKNIKARLYNKGDNILAEDYLRCLSPNSCHIEDDPILTVYFPYYKEASKVEIIKIEDGQEIILKETKYFKYDNKRKLLSYDEIKKSNTYYKESNCHHIRIAPIDKIL